MINIDTVKIKKCGQDIVTLSKELDVLINSLYSRIYNMPTVTGEWLGQASELFAKHADEIEKLNAIEFRSKLTKFGNVLIESAEKYETVINKNI